MLNDIPRIGYGTWKRRGEEAVTCTRAALDAGYRHIDTAEGYGNEAEVGQALRDSGVPRDEVWITTKVSPEHLGPGVVRPTLEASLQRLGVEQVDLVLVHWPSIRDEFGMADYLGQFADVHAAGLARTIGVSNFTVPQLDAAQEILGDLPILTNQVERHPYLANSAIEARCRELGILLTAYSPLMRGAVADDPVLQRIAKDVGGTEGQVTVAWLMAKGHVVIPTSSNPDRIAANLKGADLTLTPEQIAEIDGLARGGRLTDPDWAPKWDPE